MSKKSQAIRLSDKRLQKDYTWKIIGYIIAAMLVLFAVMRTFDSDVAHAATVEVEVDGAAQAVVEDVERPPAQTTRIG